MPLSTDLPTTKADGDANHTAGHNATNTRVNEVATEVNAHEALTSSVHGITTAAASLLDDTTTSAMRTTLGLAIGTDVQAQDADLTTIAGLTATTDNFLQAKSSAWASRTVAQVKTDLGLDTLALIGKAVRVSALKANRPGAVAQTIANTADVVIDMTDTEYNDSTSLFTVDLSANSITVNVTGTYLAMYAVTFSGGSNGDRYVHLAVTGGSDVLDTDDLEATAVARRLNGSGVVKLTSGNVLRLFGYVDGGTSATVESDFPYQTYWTLVRLS